MLLYFDNAGDRVCVYAKVWLIGTLALDHK